MYCPKQPAWMSWAMVLTGFALMGATIVFKRMELEPLVRFGVVLVAMVPMAAWVIGFKRWLREIDELERLIQLQAMGAALGSTALLVLAAALLAQAGLVSARRQTAGWLALWAWMLGAWSVSQLVIRRRYQ